MRNGRYRLKDRVEIVVLLTIIGLIGAGYGAWMVYAGATNLDLVVAETGFAIGTGNGTTVIDSSRNLTNIATLNASGVQTTAFPLALTVSGNQNWNLATRSGRFVLRSMSQGQPNVMELFTRDGDGTDFLQIGLFRVGTPESLTNFEQFTITFNSGGTGSVQLSTDSGGTGVMRNIEFLPGNENLLILSQSSARFNSKNADIDFIVETSSTAQTTLHVDAAENKVAFGGTVTAAQSAEVQLQAATLQLGDQGTQPGCNATNRGLLWYDAASAGQTDAFSVCLKNGADNYKWTTIVTVAGG